jgi:predicted HTH domain antitoxin
MNLTLPIPDDLGERLSASGADLSRRALEAFAVDEYRAGHLTLPELRRLLGFNTRAALDAFLKARDVYEDFTPEDLEQDLRDLHRLGL